MRFYSLVYEYDTCESDPRTPIQDSFVPAPIFFTDGVSESFLSTNQTGFVVDDDLFDHPVFALLVVLRFEVLSEDLRDPLPESGDESSPELLEHLIGGIFRFAVDEFEQDPALRPGHMFQYGGILLLDLVIDLLDVLFLLLFGRQAAELLLHFGHFGPGDLGDGVDLPHGVDESAVSSQIDRATEYINGKDVDQRDLIAVLNLPLLVPEAASSLSLYAGACRRENDEQKDPFFHGRRSVLFRSVLSIPGGLGGPGQIPLRSLRPCFGTVDEVSAASLLKPGILFVSAPGFSYLCRIRASANIR